MQRRAGTVRHLCLELQPRKSMFLREQQRMEDASVDPTVPVTLAPATNDPSAPLLLAL